MSNDNEDLLQAEENVMGDHLVLLTATMKGPKHIVVTSSGGGAKLGKGTGAHHFNFELDDQTNHSVAFAKLVAADDCSTCPPDPSNGNTQIDKVKFDNSGNPRTASFRDKNDNKPKMDVSYQWEFTCDDTSIKVDPFDPIITNGGRG